MYERHNEWNGSINNISVFITCIFAICKNSA
jgi:hypothetical protein